MTLIPGIGGHLSDAQQDNLAGAWLGTYDDACQALSLDGFDQMQTAPAVPFPDVRPEHYVQLEGMAYTEIMAAVDYWFGRATEKQSWIKAELLCRESAYKDAIRETKHQLREDAKLRATKKSELPSETELKEAAEREELARTLAQRITFLLAQKEVLDGRIEALNRFAAGLSRQVTLRGQELELQGMSRGRGPNPGRFGK